jgi:hypothetical protein
MVRRDWAIVSFIGCRAMGSQLGKLALLVSVMEEGKELLQLS